ncbi:hypothetical protein [Polynucleobacter sp. AP-Ainpum-60-G11]|uniref:hypothetical protein n=1 Tax=Polynucleobacter sp. AP-Ainpum-60-G11 TaxID=2576926 RepID=UPI001BFCFAC9|nr:hypothetical protein [Polynucleobacter sp. AP-Ainpum-60-G11]QWE27068.1 hypothetical protein FD971_01915 [Polynucleobacter sp. AP-Ainpum-60-G11]
MGHMLHWENIDQLHAFRLLDITPTISSFHESPMEIQYEIDGKTFHRYPDLLVKSYEYKEVWEIKKWSDMTDGMSITNIEAFKSQLLKMGYSWRTVDPKSLTLQPKKQNTIALLRYGANPIGIVEKEKALRYLERHGTISWGELKSGLIGPQGPKIICRLVIEGYIYFDINQVWSNKTIFQWRKSFLEPLREERL